MSANLLVTNIGELLTLRATDGNPLGLVRGAVVAIEEGRVVFAGRKSDLPVSPSRFFPVDAGGALVTPGLVEPHAHPIFAGSRADEFARRARGQTYAAIQAAGGGILSTVRATRSASDEELITSTYQRLDRFLRHGVTVCEAKTGYSLDVEGELRLLGLLGDVRRRHPIDLSPTLLAHVPPPDEDRAGFVERFAAEAIPRAAHAGAEAFDVYCDQGAFTVEESRTMLTAAQRAGLALRVHAEQFTHTGVAHLAAELGARSVEHLEQIDDGALAALAKAGTVCNLLPGAALSLKLPWPDARRMVAAGCTVALGTDLNPGSSLCESSPLMMSLACMQMGLSVEEAWRGVTVAAARAVGRSDAGHLASGARGDLVIWSTDDHREVVQHVGENLVGRVFIQGVQR